MKITPEQLKDYLKQAIDNCQYEMDRFGQGALMNGHTIHNHGAQWAYKHILEVIEKGFDDE